MPKLDAFARQYVETLLWSETDDNGEPLDGLYSVDDIATEALAQIQADCASFQTANEELISLATSTDSPVMSNRERAAHDFCLTRNGHGAGFWDRDLGELGDQLSDAATAYGTQGLYVGDDGLLYVHN